MEYRPVTKEELIGAFLHDKTLYFRDTDFMRYHEVVITRLYDTWDKGSEVPFTVVYYSCNNPGNGSFDLQSGQTYIHSIYTTI